MSIGARIGARAGARIGARIGTSPGSTAAPSTTTCTLTLADSVDPVITGGDAFAYTAVVKNTGGVSASNLSLAITLDASMTYSTSSGTGWSISRVGQVVTCTLATLAAGATANTITINVTTGGSALTASTSGALTGSNFTEVDATETTTVQLVTKDATAGIYLPASGTEWTNFLARKGLSGVFSAPTGVWNLQEASGNASDASGNGFTLTATGTITYAQSQTGWSRSFMQTTDGTSAALTTTSASLPDPATTSYLLMNLIIATAAGAAVRQMMKTGGTSPSLLQLSTAAKMRVTSTTNADSTAVDTGSVQLHALQTNRTAVTVTGYNHSEKISPTAASVSTKNVTLLGPFAGKTGYSVLFTGASAECSSANLKLLYQAMGITPSWS